MDHDELREDLSAFIDGELSPEHAARLQGHLAGCDSCRRELDSLKAASGRVRAQGGVRAPEGLAESILEKASAPEPARRPDAALRFAASLLVVALALYGVGVLFKPQISGMFNQIMGMLSGAASTVGSQE